MRPLFILPLALWLAACQPPKSSAPAESETSTPPVPAAPVETVPAPLDVKASVVRINSTQQSWSTWQPWEKEAPQLRRALAAIIAPQRVITTAELVADATYLEFESPDGTRFAPAEVLAVDYEANLALLGPAPGEEGKAFFEGTVPFEISEPAIIGETLEVLQIEENGAPLQTAGTLQSVDVESNFLPAQAFLTYMVKASMQSAASSYTLPVLHGGKFAGVLLTYDSKDQLCEVSATDIVTRFLQAASNGEYEGFPSLGVVIARTEDPSFRAWLKLPDDQGGIYIQRVRKGGAADLAGVKPGDVLMAVDGHAIDRRGYYEHPNYGALFWGHLVRGEKTSGASVALSLLREGKPVDVNATLLREEENKRLVPNHLFDQAPNYLVKGGLVFQELTRPILQGFGKDWESRAPLNLLDAYQNPEKYEEKLNRIVFLSGVIPTPATVGYEPLRNLIVKKVNGKEIKDMKSLIAAFNSNLAELHSIEFDDENLTVHLDDSIATAVDSQLLQRGLTRLSHAD